MTTFETRGVLSGCYRGKRANLKALLTHYAKPGTEDAVCGRVQPGGLCDQVLEGPPTCPICLARAAKAKKGASKAASPAGPRIGQLTKVYGVDCRIFQIHPFGTVDVVSLDGERAWRLSGLSFGARS